MVISESEFKEINLRRSSQDAVDLIEALAKDGEIQVVPDEEIEDLKESWEIETELAEDEPWGLRTSSG